MYIVKIAVSKFVVYGYVVAYEQVYILAKNQTPALVKHRS